MPDSFTTFTRAGTAVRLAQWAHSRRQRQWWRRVSRALGLEPRAGEPRRPAALGTVSTQLEIEWYAHNVHPWDEDLPPDGQEARFAEEAVQHTLSAIRRAFQRFPEVDTLQIMVRDPRKPHPVLFTGRVLRADSTACSNTPSPAMALKLLGIEFRMIDGRLQPLR
jgi:hypothetical protein